MENISLFNFLLLIIGLSFNFNSAFSNEYRLGLFKDNIFDPNTITHIIVIGTAKKEDSDQFFQSGVARAYRYKEIWPNHQVVIISSPDVVRTSNASVFSKYGLAVFKIVEENFTGARLIKELQGFSQIAGLDYYGHSSPWALKLGLTNATFNPNAYSESLKNLRNHFMANAYVTLNGCNTGFIIAPALSRALALPVSGSLTSTVFEKIESDGHWYREEDWHRRGHVESNGTSYKEELPCSLGVCNRMKPTLSNYSSIWGTFDEGGLSFNKFFCHFDDNSDNHCEKGMARALLSFPSLLPIDQNASRDEFATIAFDWLCSTSKKRSYFKDCVSGIKSAIVRGDLIFQTHPGNELSCDFHSCKAEVVCKYDEDNEPIPGSCKLKTSKNLRPATAAREFLSLMKGYELIKSESPAFMIVL
ncbi:MAG: hypothetical protein ACXVLQ_18225 [Bacteriovorax sp.]